MRLQWIVPCSRREITAEGGSTLHGVGGQLTLRGQWEGSAEGPSSVPFNLYMVGCFIEGTAGKHTTWLTAHPPGQEPQSTSTAPAEFEWPQNEPTYVMEYRINMKVPPLDGTWEFSIVVDDESIGVGLLPIRFLIQRAG